MRATDFQPQKCAHRAFQGAKMRDRRQQAHKFPVAPRNYPSNHHYNSINAKNTDSAFSNLKMRANSFKSPTQVGRAEGALERAFITLKMRETPLPSSTSLSFAYSLIHSFIPISVLRTLFIIFRFWISDFKSRLDFSIPRRFGFSILEFRKYRSWN
jgi:hypothetical protein